MYQLFLRLHYNTILNSKRFDHTFINYWKRYVYFFKCLSKPRWFNCISCTVFYWKKPKEDFLREFCHFIDWKLLSQHTLSEEFITEHRDFVDWNCISKWQILSKDFIKQHQDQVNMYYITNKANPTWK